MKIVIIKLGALGDVVRTLSVLPAIKEKYPESEISWITKKESLQLFENNPYTNHLFSLPYKTSEEFDVLFNFDIDKEATTLALDIKAKKKFGFYLKEGFPSAFNLASEYYLNTLFDDELKKTNKKTYQEMMFEAAELEYKKQHCQIYLTEKDKEYSKKFLDENQLKTENLIGIHMGASSRWLSKAWHEDNLKEFIKKSSQKGYEILLFAGPDEAEKQKKILNEMSGHGIKIFANNPENTLKEFASLVSLCKKMICSDSLSMHVSLALKKPVIGLFFCTSPNEVEGYGLLKKLVSPLLNNFFPEKCDLYNEELVKSISAEEVLKAIEYCK